MYYNVSVRPEQCCCCGYVRPARKMYIFPGREMEGQCQNLVSFKNQVIDLNGGNWNLEDLV